MAITDSMGVDGIKPTMHLNPSQILFFWTWSFTDVPALQRAVCHMCLEQFSVTLPGASIIILLINILSNGNG